MRRDTLVTARRPPASNYEGEWDRGRRGGRCYYDERTRHSFGGIAAGAYSSAHAFYRTVKGGKRTLEPARGGDHEEDEQEEARAEADRGHDVVAVALDGARPARGGAYRLLCPGDAAYGR